MTDANPRRTDSLEVNETDDGLVVYDPSQEMVHHLNPSAAVIFDLCDGTRDVAEIASILAEVYDLDGPATDDALAGLGELADRGLIDWDAHRAPEG